jgi:hypothetical protein
MRSAVAASETVRSKLPLMGLPSKGLCPVMTGSGVWMVHEIPSWRVVFHYCNSPP